MNIRHTLQTWLTSSCVQASSVARAMDTSHLASLSTPATSCCSPSMSKFPPKCPPKVSYLSFLLKFPSPQVLLRCLLQRRRQEREGKSGSSRGWQEGNVNGRLGNNILVLFQGQNYASHQFLLDPIGSQYIRAISVTDRPAGRISPHVFRTRYNHIILTRSQ